MSLYDDTIARLGFVLPRSASLPSGSAAANPCARLAHAKRPRAGPLSAAARIRRKYSERPSALLSMILAVTSVMTGWVLTGRSPARLGRPAPGASRRRWDR